MIFIIHARFVSTTRTWLQDSYIYQKGYRVNMNISDRMTANTSYYSQITNEHIISITLLKTGYNIIRA